MTGFHMTAIRSAIVPRVGEPGPGLAHLLRIFGGGGATEASRGDKGQLETGRRHCGALAQRSELAKRIVEAAASKIEDVVLKVAMTESLLLEGDFRVGLTPQCLEECDRAIAQEGDGEQCLKALKSELWALCERVRGDCRARGAMGLRR